MLVSLTAKGIATESSKTHFCLLFMSLVKCKHSSSISKIITRNGPDSCYQLFLYLFKWSSKWVQITSVT